MLEEYGPDLPYSMSSGSDAELESVYSPLGQPLAIYAHIHQPYIRPLSEIVVANTGSVSLSYDGDRRSAYLLLDGRNPSIRRVEHDVDREIEARSASGLQHSDWMAKILQSARPQMP
jgi:predicted phosphodiesterase